jgi:hypothetical protein
LWINTLTTCLCKTKLKIKKTILHLDSCHLLKSSQKAESVLLNVLLRNVRFPFLIFTTTATLLMHLKQSYSSRTTFKVSRIQLTLFQMYRAQTTPTM